jgi:hypothetical protein
MMAMTVSNSMRVNPANERFLCQWNAGWLPGCLHLRIFITRSFLDKAEASKIYLAPINDPQQMEVARECGPTPENRCAPRRADH